MFAGITCLRPTAPANGQVTQPIGSPQYGSQATFTCNSGYRYFDAVTSVNITNIGLTIPGNWSFEIRGFHEIQRISHEIWQIS